MPKYATYFKIDQCQVFAVLPGQIETPAGEVRIYYPDIHGEVVSNLMYTHLVLKHTCLSREDALAISPHWIEKFERAYPLQQDSPGKATS